MFDEKTLERLRHVYNSEHPHESPIHNRDIWSSLKKRLRKKCTSGKSECIIAHLLQRQKAPDAWITKPNEWLSSEDIDSVEAQYMTLFPSYKFLGCIPIDFDLKTETGKCLVNTLCSLKIKDLRDQGTTQIGIIFNTDVHDGPGQHWFALYCDIRPDVKARVTYFDSYASPPEPEIKELMSRWNDEIPMEPTYNLTRHQYKDSECGMYCLYFHYCCLNDIPLDERIPDNIMILLFRHLLFKVG
jgi:hypothetical protein